MAIIDRIKFEGAPETLVWKFPKDNIVKGAQLIVNESQEAVFLRTARHLIFSAPAPIHLTAAIYHYFRR